MKLSRKITNFILFLSGLFVTIISLGVVLGYAFDIVWLVSWGGAQFMAVPTAFCFLAIGIQQVIISFNEKP